MIKDSLCVFILLQAHLTTTVQHHEGRALLPQQQPRPTTATDPLQRGRVVDGGEQKEGRGREGRIAPARLIPNWLTHR